MRNFNFNFNRWVTNNPSPDLRFTIEVQWDDAGTKLVYFLSHSDSGSPVGVTTIHSIADLSSASQALKNRYAIAEIGSFNFTLADIGDAITSELNTRFGNDITPVRKKATLYVGEKNLDWVDYEPVDVWFIDDVENYGSGYKFRASDIQRDLKQKIFTPDKSRLSASMTSSQTHIPLTLATSSTKFPSVVHDSDYTFNPSATVGYVKIDDEIIAHDGNYTTHPTDGTSLGVVSRGAMNTVAAAHKTDDSADEDKGKEVTEVTYIESKVVDIIHLVLTGENVSGSATIPDHWNAGLSTSLIDDTSFADLNAEMPDRLLRFIGEEEQDAKQFIEQQCMRFYGLFQTVLSNGKLKIQRYERTLQETSPVIDIDNTNLVDAKDLSQSASDIINVYKINYNYDHVSDKLTRPFIYLDSASSNANGSFIKNETFEFRGVHTSIHSDNDIRNFIYQTRELYSNAPYNLSVTADSSVLGVEVGDVVRVNTHIKKDYVSGSDVDHSFLVRKRSVDYSDLSSKLELIGTGLAAEAILDPGAVGSLSELDNSFITGTGTNLETLTEVSNGTLGSDLTLTGTSDINAAGSIWYIDDNFIVPTGVTLTLVNNVQIRATGTIDFQSGSTVTSKGNGRSGITFGNSLVSGFFGNTRSGPGAHVVFKPFNLIFSEELVGGVTNEGDITSLPVLNLRNEDGQLSGLPNDLRGTPGSPGTKGRLIDEHDNITDYDGGNGGDSGAGLLTLSRGLTIGTTADIDLSGNDGTTGTSFTAGGNTYYAGSGAGGSSGSWYCLIDGDYTAPTFEQVTADIGDSPDVSSGFLGSNAGFSSRSLTGSATRIQFIPASKSVEDDGTSGVRQLDKVTGVSVTSGEDTLLIHNNGNVQERALVTWSEISDTDVSGYQVQAKQTADPDWITVAITDGADDTRAYFNIEDGVQYDVRVRAITTSDNVQVGTWSATATHTGVGTSDLTAIAAPANVSVASGTAQLLTLSDGSIVERMKVTWDASADPLWTATEVEFKKATDSTWQEALLTNSANVLESFIVGEGGNDYDIRLRHLSGTRPNSGYTTVSAHTLVGETAPPSDVTNFKVSQNGDTINFIYDLISDADRNGYLIRFGVTGISWEDATPLSEETKGTKITSSYVPPGTWDFLIKAIDRSKNVSTNAARTTLTVENKFDIVSEVDHEPGWRTGSTSGYWIHYLGMLVPLDQNAASTYGYEMFDDVVPNPVATSSYTSDEQDGLVQARMRIWAGIDSVLARGTTGTANPQFSVDYRDDGGSYDGFEDWTIEEVNARYAKFKITNDNVNDGIAIVRGLKTVADAVERKESDKNVTVAAGGTAITFDDSFRFTPFISVFTQGGGGLVPDSASDSTTGFTFHIYDSSGTSVGGTGKWVAEGI